MPQVKKRDWRDVCQTLKFDPTQRTPLEMPLNVVQGISIDSTFDIIEKVCVERMRLEVSRTASSIRRKGPSSSTIQSRYLPL